jgi:hypothetical protein
MGWGVGLSIVLVGCGGSVVENAPAEDAALDAVDTGSAPEDGSVVEDSSMVDTAVEEDTAIVVDSAEIDTGGDDSASADSGPFDTGSVDTGSDTGPSDTGPFDTGSDTGPFDTGSDTMDAGVAILSDILTPSAASCTISACGRWTFGSAPSSTGAITAFPSFTYRSYPSYAPDGGPLKWWAGTSTSTLPMVMYNTGADTPFHPTKKVTVHPGNSGVNAIVEWVAPTSANYKITGSFQGKDSGSRLVRVLVVGGATLLDQTLTGTATVPISIASVAVTAGQKIRFAVDPNGVPSNDTTLLDAQLEWAAPSPCTAATDGAACGSNMHCCGGACVASASTLTCGATSCTACAVPAHAYSTCSGTACGFTCSQGYGDCNTTASDGCEKPITNDINNCGGCGSKCATPAASMHQNPTCTGTTCGASCATGYGDCNTTAGDGCERAITNDVNNCGGCNTKCPTPSATLHQNPTCTGTTCGLACATGYGNCNGTAADGCERAITNDVDNCGACGKKCPAPATSMNQTADCSGTTCGATCNLGFTDCDANPANGCECGAGIHETASCDAILGCTKTCDPGFDDCDGLPGCEVDVNSDNSHCGNCFTTCPTWSGSVCSFGHCVP